MAIQPKRIRAGLAALVLFSCTVTGLAQQDPNRKPQPKRQPVQRKAPPARPAPRPTPRPVVRKTPTRQPQQGRTPVRRSQPPKVVRKPVRASQAPSPRRPVQRPVVRKQAPAPRRVQSSAQQRQKTAANQKIVARRNAVVQQTRVTAQKRQATRAQQNRVTSQQRQKANTQQARVAQQKRQAANTLQSRVAAQKRQEVNVQRSRVAAQKREQVNTQRARVAAQKREQVNVQRARVAAQQRRTVNVNQARIAAQQRRTVNVQNSRVAAAQRAADFERNRQVFAQRRRQLPAPVRWTSAYRVPDYQAQRVPPQPQSFNFVGNRRWQMDQRYQNAPVYVDQRTIIRDPGFVEQVPMASGFRIGFSQYDSGFSNVSFSYSNYSYWPYARTVSSPWYYYSQLPPYLPVSAVYVQQPVAYDSSYDSYDWAPPAPTREYTTVDYCVNDIDRSYSTADPSLILQLIPSDGLVGVYLDGSYRYSVSPIAFRPMLTDCVRHVRSTGYQVDWVRHYHDGSYFVQGRHNTIDSWGNHQSIYQTYRMEP